MLNPTPTALWTAPVEDQPGGLARLLEPLAKQGADLQFIMARRVDGQPGKSLVYVSPLGQPAELTAAESAGFRCLPAEYVVRLEGNNEPGLGFLMARAMAAEKINMRAVATLALRSQFAGYLVFDSEADAARAIRRLNMGL